MIDRLGVRGRCRERLGRRACELRSENEADARQDDHNRDGRTPLQGQHGPPCPSVPCLGLPTLLRRLDEGAAWAIAAAMEWRAPFDGEQVQSQLGVDESELG